MLWFCGDLMAASITGAIFALTAGIVVLFSAKISDKIKRADLIVILGYLLIGLGFLLFIFANSLLFLFLIQIVIGLGEAIYAPAFDKLYSSHLTPAKTGREWGAWEATHYFAIAVGAVLGGIIVTNFGFNVLFMIMALLCFFSAFYIYKLPKHIL
ncbi:MFS transporter [Candidatus Daviesbacteria bacterium]|nr:MFS transporter [Candidatus Daviesbacteria bacterium]